MRVFRQFEDQRAHAGAAGGTMRPAECPQCAVHGCRGQVRSRSEDARGTNKKRGPVVRPACKEAPVRLPGNLWSQSTFFASSREIEPISDRSMPMSARSRSDRACSSL